MSQEEDKKLGERIHGLFASQETASKMVDLLVSKKPEGVTNSSHYPYYKEYYANKLKASIDKMIQDKQDIIYRYSLYCEGPDAISEQTLYLMVNQATRYLIEKMDLPDLRYRNWHNTVRTQRSKTRGGVVISYLRGFGNTNLPDFVGESVDAVVDDSKPKWRYDMDAWLESDDEKPFMKDRLTLSKQEVIELKAEIDQCMGVRYSIDATCIKLLRMKV